MRGLLPVWVALLLLLAGPGAGVASAVPGHDVASVGSQPPSSGASVHAGLEAVAFGDVTAAIHRQTSPAPPDPSTDRLGWENGYWYNESIDVTPEDGLDERELDAVVARSMARVEVIREIEFETTPPVRVITREEFRANTNQRYANANITPSNRLHQNVKWEAMFMVGENTDVIGVQRQNAAEGTLGFYVSGNASGIEGVSKGDIVLISENEEAPQVDEITLSQELFHALQDQQLKTTPDYNISTEEDLNAVLGVIEGDGNYVDYLYEQRCTTEWDCLLPGESNAGASERHVGLLLVALTPYSEGPPFVAQIREQGGWEAVNDLYDDPPVSTEQLIHPDKYPDERPRNLSIENRSSEGWHVLDLNGTDHATFGEAGLFVMLWYPSFLAREDVVVPVDIFGEAPPGLYDYSTRFTDGWDGDRLLPYVNDTSTRDNETGYVWKTAWDTPRDAREFATGYRGLLQFHEAEQVGENTYVVPSGSDGDFGDAFHLSVEGDTVTIVNAPTVEALSRIDTSVTVEPIASSATATDGGSGDGAGGNGDRTRSNGNGSGGDSGDASDSSSADGGTTGPSESVGTSVENPGLGAAAALLAVVALSVVLLIRHRRE